jgi:flagellar assembly protein FliH
MNASNPTSFVFQTEFGPDGAVVGTPQSKFVPRVEAEKLVAVARNEGEVIARQSSEARAYAAIDRMVAHVTPVQKTLALLATDLRREAAELALASARRLAGDALDSNGAALAAEAVAQVISVLKAAPVVTVIAEPDALPVIERRMEQLRREGKAAGIVFAADPAAKPGDWRVQWSEGASSFSRDVAEAAMSEILDRRLDDPVEPQLELFSAG